MSHAFRTAAVGASLVFLCAVTSCRFRMRVSSGKRARVQQALDSVRQAADSFMAGLETGASFREVQRLGSTLAIDSIVTVFRDSCDFDNRFGGYAGHVVRKDQRLGTVAILLYDYSLRCGRRSFLLAYRLRPRICLTAFHVLQAGSANPLVQEIRRSAPEAMP